MINKDKTRAVLRALRGESINLTYRTSKGINSVEACKVIGVSKNYVTLAKPIPIYSQEADGLSEIIFDVIIGLITEVKFYSGSKM